MVDVVMLFPLAGGILARFSSRIPSFMKDFPKFIGFFISFPAENYLFKSEGAGQRNDHTSSGK